MLRIKELRKELGFSQLDVAEMIGVTQASISGWEAGKFSIDNLNLIKLAKVFCVSSDYILGISNLRPVTEVSLPGTKIDVLGRVPAGVPIEAVEYVVDEVELSYNMSKNAKDYFALMVSGDSMYPEYFDGDIVIVKKQTSAETGDDVIAYVDGYDATIKRLIKSDKGLTLRAINPAYETKSYSYEEVGRLPVLILGVVAEQRRNR